VHGRDEKFIQNPRKPKRKRPIEWPRIGWKDNIKGNHKINWLCKYGLISTNGPGSNCRFFWTQQLAFKLHKRWEVLWTAACQEGLSWSQGIVYVTYFALNEACCWRLRISVEDWWMAIHMHANFLVLKNMCEYREKYSYKVPNYHLMA